MKIGTCVASLALTGLSFAVSGAAFAQACAARPDLLLCGSSQRPLSGLYSASGPFNEVSSCAPNASTQAMYVSRAATIAGNGPAWLAYLNAGGRIITEFSIGAAVYNEIYGTAIPDGPNSGGCNDNPMPSAKLNTGHPFWVANPIPATPSGSEGCGLDLSAVVAGDPGITPLGARSADTSHINFAIKPQGSGTLFLLEADWQDVETVPFDADNLAFLDGLIGYCGGGAPPRAQSAAPVPVDDGLALGGIAAAIALLGAALARRKRFGLRRS